MLIYVLLNRSCGTFSCAFYTYVLLPTSLGIFQCTFSTYVPLPIFPGTFQCTFFTYVPLPTFPETFKLTFSLYVPKTQGNAHEKENVPHTETFPLSFMYLFFQLLCWPQVWHGGLRTDQQAIMRAVMQRMWTATN